MNQTPETPAGRRAVRARIVRTLGAALWRHRGASAGAAALMIGARLGAVAVPVALKQLIDHLGHVRSLAMVPVLLALAYALLRFVADALGEARDVAFSIVVQRAVASLRESTFAQLHRLGARFHAQRETGAIVRDVQKGADGLGFLLGTALFSVLPTLFEIAVVVAIVATHYGRAFVLAIAGTFACYALYTAIFTRRRLANQRALSVLHVGQSGVVAAGIAAVMLVAVQQVAAGAMTIGDLVLVNAYIIQVCAPLNTLGFVFREANDALVDVERLFGLLSARGTPGEDEDVPGARPLVVSEGELGFHHVDFGYDDGRLVLHDLVFTAAPGQTVAVVGGSGSGKSTLIRLLFRFYRPQRGTITLDGQDIANGTLASLNAAIGIVPQDTVLFNETIAWNIAYGRPDATRADVVRAARAAQLDDLIERLPDHYETRVGERGVRLSGGERQRIAIARAMLKNPRVMVFDEATSALDTRSERAIQDELRRLARGRTTIVVAHRLSTVVDADVILVMEHGRIVERGRHEALLARDGVYAKMWAMQWQQDDLEHAERRLVAAPLDVMALLERVAARVRESAPRAAVRVAGQSVQGLSVMAVDGDALYQALVLLAANEAREAGARDEPRARDARTGRKTHHARDEHNPRDGAHALQLDARRRDNTVLLCVTGGAQPAPLDDDALAHLEALLREAGASFTLDPGDGHVRYAVAVPLHVLASASSPASASEPVRAAQRSGELAGLRVAVLDDEAETRDALEAALALHGATVEVAAGGARWLAALRERPRAAWPDAVLCDLDLGAEDGTRVIAALREIEVQACAPARRIPAIAMTGRVAREAETATERGLFVVRLGKPIAVPALVATLARATGRTGGTRERTA
ncbi:ATP-binding cassette domain-containing protein [Paraburkholderia sp. J63]|uniref:ATP-binding cassette domain-containing protein n=1 Tax=Paraburkholderia sp. J63 TaxID=2805434 RepID=UPI002ABD7A15|nr:ATP-binding cassette domain-containing protein [Paraburkholderia sp. J63]